jgi:hypothetical protein
MANQARTRILINKQRFSRNFHRFFRGRDSMKENRRIAAFRCIGILTLGYFSSVPDLLVPDLLCPGFAPDLLRGSDGICVAMAALRGLGLVDHLSLVAAPSSSLRSRVAFPMVVTSSVPKLLCPETPVPKLLRSYVPFARLTPIANALNGC